MGASDAPPGEPVTAKSKVLDTGASVVQEFGPVNSICAHLNAFHVYASDTKRFAEANHFCSHVTEDLRQCLLYDSPEPNARLIGIEYMISPALFATIKDPAERRLWHSHVFEAKSGMLVMPQPASSVTPAALWKQAELTEMSAVTQLYGKAYHLWQYDRGDALPLGEPQLVTSFTDPAQLTAHGGAVEAALADRDKRFGTDWRANAEARKDLDEMEVHPDADHAWKK